MTLQGSPDWEVRGALGNRWLFVLRELLQLLPSWEGVRADASRFLKAAQQALQAAVSMIAGALQLPAFLRPQSSQQELPFRCARTMQQHQEVQHACRCHAIATKYCQVHMQGPRVTGEQLSAQSPLSGLANASWPL